MNAKLKLLCTGDKTIVELDGKTMGKGVEAIEFQHNSNGDVKAKISIDLDSFSFMPDGYFEQAEKSIAEATPPEEGVIGRE